MANNLLKYFYTVTIFFTFQISTYFNIQGIVVYLNASIWSGNGKISYICHTIPQNQKY